MAQLRIKRIRWSVESSVVTLSWYFSNLNTYQYAVRDIGVQPNFYCLLKLDQHSKYRACTHSIMPTQERVGSLAHQRWGFRSTSPPLLIAQVSDGVRHRVKDKMLAQQRLQKYMQEPDRLIQPQTEDIALAETRGIQRMKEQIKKIMAPFDRAWLAVRFTVVVIIIHLTTETTSGFIVSSDQILPLDFFPTPPVMIREFGCRLFSSHSGPGFFASMVLHKALYLGSATYYPNQTELISIKHKLRFILFKSSQILPW